MPYRRAFRKAGTYVKKTAVGRLKKRYVRRNNRVNFQKVIKDVAYIKSALNTERKHLDTLITSNVSQSNVVNTLHPRAAPTRSNPIIYPLGVPQRGTGYNERIGNQIKLTNISIRYIINKSNTTNQVHATSLRCFIFFAKNAEDVPLASELLEVDAEGDFTPASYWNSQNYRNFFFPKGLKYQKTIRDYHGSSTAGTIDTGDGQVKLYPKTSQTMGTKVTFENGSDNVTQMKPYIMFLTDNIDTTNTSDPIHISAQIRLSYVDN